MKIVEIAFAIFLIGYILLVIYSCFIWIKSSLMSDKAIGEEYFNKMNEYGMKFAIIIFGYGGLSLAIGTLFCLLSMLF